MLRWLRWLVDRLARLLCGIFVGHNWAKMSFHSLAWGEDMAPRKFRRCRRCGKMETL